ncbi:MAG TPA: DUF1570 domain-containing protein [Lysobacter sp.]
MAILSECGCGTRPAPGRRATPATLYRHAGRVATAAGALATSRILPAGIDSFLQARRLMKTKAIALSIFLVALAAFVGHRYWLNGHHPVVGEQPPVEVATSFGLPPATATLETAHYTIAYTATPSQAAQVADAAESLHGAYMTLFGAALKSDADRPKLKLVLYRDQQEFKAHNRSSPWAEAFYLAPYCHAYYADGPNPYHWMVHEATHQLNHERAGLRPAAWMEEGLASYFGASRIRDRTLTPGTIAIDAYPIWWLPRLDLSGDLQDDIRMGRIIPLRALLDSRRGDIGSNVNGHYIGYWSLTHFLFHYDNGRYAGRYRQLMASGGSLEDFERLLGPVERVEVQWYEYLQQRVAEVAGHAAVSYEAIPTLPQDR